jgi:hypothetical protein
MKPLAIPPHVLADDDEAVQVLSVWQLGNSLHTAFRGGLWANEPRGWGVAFASVARLVASAMAVESGADEEKVLDRIRDTFLREIDERERAVSSYRHPGAH